MLTLQVLEQGEDTSARERNREELADLLLSDRSGMSAIREAATRANWPLPATGAVVLVATAVLPRSCSVNAVNRCRVSPW